MEIHLSASGLCQEVQKVYFRFCKRRTAVLSCETCVKIVWQKPHRTGARYQDLQVVERKKMNEHVNELCFGKIWVTKIIESTIPFHVRNPLLASIAKFGIVPDLIFAILYFYLAGFEVMPADFLVGAILALVWLNVGPFLIWYYDERLLPGFFCKAVEIVPDSQRTTEIAKKYDKLFSQKSWVATLPWTLFLTFLYTHFAQLSPLEMLMMENLSFWVGLMAVVWAGFLTGIGFFGVMTTMLAIREISQEPLHIDPLHPDKLGGLSCIGYYAIGTTVLFSSGSLFFPLAFELIFMTSAITSHVYAAMSIFSIFVLLSFLYRTIITNHKARSMRDEVLDKLRKRYRELQRFLQNSSGHMNKMAYYAEINEVRNGIWITKMSGYTPLKSTLL